MAGIDKADQMRSYCNISRKSVKWSKKMAMYLINCALINAYILYKKSKDQISNLPFKVFAETISEEWLDLESVPDIPRNINVNRSHLPSIIPNKKRRTAPHLNAYHVTAPRPSTTGNVLYYIIRMLELKFR